MMSTPRRIVVLRHAEKPDDGTVTLSTRGQIRAVALAVFLRTLVEKPDYVFATRDSENSDRPLLTIKPFAEAVGVGVSDAYKDSKYTELVAELFSKPKYDDKQIAICWHHGKIPELVTALGVQDPPKWPDTVFDRYWLIEFSAGSISAQCLPQQLLFGDSVK